MVIRIPTLARPIRHLLRYRHIIVVFARHGFGFAISHLPAEPEWLHDLHPLPTPEPSSLPAHFRQALEELGPTFVKLGQMLSTRPDLLPPDYINELAKLQDSVPPVPWEEIRQVLEDELGKPAEKVFASVTRRPIAAASLAQVHAAQLPGGEKVVVKIQRPNILPTIQTDLEIIQDLAHYVGQHTALGRLYNMEDIAEDFADTLNNELNYQREARNADRFRANFAGKRGLYIPEVYRKYSTKRVLVLERIDGIKIDDIPALDRAGYNRSKIATNAAHMIVKEVLEDGFFHADPHPGNFIVMKGEVIGAMDFGMVGYLGDQDRNNLIRLYTVAVRMDTQGVVDELIHIGAAPPDVNRRALARDIERLMRFYSGLPLKEVRASEFIDDVMPIAFEHHLRLPTNLWLLGKTLAMMEGIGLKLDPDFDILAFSGPYVTKLLLQVALPDRRWAEGILRRGMVWGDLFDEIPRAARLLLDRFEKREPIKLSLDQSNLDRLDRLVTRMVLSLIVTGMIIGLALVIPSTTQSTWLIQAVVILSFVIAMAIGAWVLISIVRKK